MRSTPSRPQSQGLARGPIALLALLACLLPPACRTEAEVAGRAAAPAVARTVEIGKLRWYVDYEQALALARQVHKPLWVHFGEHPG